MWLSGTAYHRHSERSCASEAAQQQRQDLVEIGRSEDATQNRKGSDGQEIGIQRSQKDVEDASDMETWIHRFPGHSERIQGQRKEGCFHIRFQISYQMSY